MYIKIHIYPDSKEDTLEVISDDLYKVKVRAPAERGLANSILLDLLHQKHTNKKIKIVSGHLHPHKIVSVE
jgi:uncharacterized protein (TIGR00251 family)